MTTSNAVDRIATPSTPAPVEAEEMVPFGAHTSELVLWAYEARQAKQIATALAKTSFVPLSLRGKPDDITAAILAGQELGLKPMATLRSIDVIQGTPGLRAHAQRALVQSHGHKVQLVVSTDKVCRMRGRRKDEGDDDWQEVEWDLKRAADMGLLGKAEWKKQPKTMLVARATGEICRLIASDVLHGMPYNAEELRDSEESEQASTPRVTAAELLAQARTAATHPQPSPEPVAIGSGTPDEAPVVDGPDRSRIPGLFVAADIMGVDERAAYVADVVGREVARLVDLTEDKAAALIEALERFIAQSEPGNEP